MRTVSHKQLSQAFDKLYSMLDSQVMNYGSDYSVAPFNVYYQELFGDPPRVLRAIDLLANPSVLRNFDYIPNQTLGFLPGDVLIGNTPPFGDPIDGFNTLVAAVSIGSITALEQNGSNGRYFTTKRYELPLSQPVDILRPRLRIS